MPRPAAQNNPKPVPTGTVSDPDDPNPFGPDAPNTRDDDPPASSWPPLAAPPTPSTAALDEADFAPDES